MSLDKKQLIRGVLESCVLKIVSNKETYGYEIVNELAKIGFEDSKEGTLYPILLRLEKRGLITATYRDSPLGPKRKYYTITPGGSEYLNEFRQQWREINETVKQVFGEE